MLLTKQVGDHPRLLLASIQMAAYNGDVFGPVGRPTLAEPVGLDVLIQQFIGVQFRAVAGSRISRSRDEWVAAKRVAFPDLCTRCPSTIR